jgi:hypothetical protein
VAARAADSRDKRRRALDAVQNLEAAGEPVTFPAVARSARVSTWLVYAPGVREHVEAARRRQTVPGIDTSSTTPLATRTDLALAREEIMRLRADRDKLQQRLRLQLGAEIEGEPAPHCLIADATSTEANTSLLLSPGGPGGAGAGVAAWTGYCNYSPLGLEVETFTLSGAASNSIAFEAVIPSTP